MAESSVRVEGLPRLRRTLKKAGDNLADMKSLHRQIGQVVANRARATGPKRTGALRSSVRPSSATAAVRVLMGSGSVQYAGPIHWGWPRRGILSQPFVADAAKHTESTWLPMYERGIQSELNKVEGA